MQQEISSIEEADAVFLRAREDEYALVLLKMIRMVEQDPTQLRLAIYQLARMTFQNNSAFSSTVKQKHLSASLEAAIRRVEIFSSRADAGRRQRREPFTPQLQIAQGSAAMRDGLIASQVIPQLDKLLNGAIAKKSNHKIKVLMQLGQKWRSRENLMWFLVGIFLAVVIIDLVLYIGASSVRPEDTMSATPALSELRKDTKLVPEYGAALQTTDVSFDTMIGLERSSVIAPGVYALNNGVLNELQALTIPVPDRRIAMSTPISQPTHTLLPNGKNQFLIFLTGIVTDAIDVRAVARVARAVKFDPNGKPITENVANLWVVRNISYEFSVRSVPGSREMFLIQPKDPDFKLPPGRYVLALKNEGYEFTVDGKVDDPAQCLERMDAMNGSFYSVCQN